jgi:ADP-ribose pyrophosphatase
VTPAVTDRAERWPVISSAEQASGRLITVRTDEVRMPDGAERELLEEAGYRAADWHALTDYFSSPGIITERLRIFLARDLEPVPEAERDFVPEHEEAHLVVGWLPLDEAVEKVLAGELHNGVAVTGILAAYAARTRGFAALRAADAPET